MNVVIYARYSSHGQTEQSIEGQVQACYDFCKRNDYTIIGEYIDRAQSGTSDKRDDFQRMIEDSGKRLFTAVVVYQLDRFARNRYDSAHYKMRLKKNGVRVLSARENITDDASGVLMEAVLEGMAEYYSKELGQKVVRGMKLSAEKCLSTGGHIALGYKVGADKHFEIDDETAPIVIDIFKKYASGQSVKQINDYLNKKKIKTSTGVLFNKNSLCYLLRNKRYIGIFTFKDMEIPGGIPRIIDDELYNKVQGIMDGNKKAPARAKAKEEYILTLKLFCGHCRDMMTGYGGTSQSGKKYYYYACNGMKRKQCNKKIVNKQFIEDYVVNKCRELLTDDNIKMIANNVVALCEKEKDTSNLKRLNKLLKDNERKRNNTANAITECNDDSVRRLMYEQVPKLEKEKADIEQQIALEEASHVDIPYPAIVSFFKELRKGNIDSLKYRKTLVNILINWIFLFDNKITFIFNVGDTPVTIDDEMLSEIDRNNGEFESSFIGEVVRPKIRPGTRRYTACTGAEHYIGVILSL